MPTRRAAASPGPDVRPETAAPSSAVALPTPTGQDASTRVLRQFRMVFNAVKTHFQQVERTAGIGGAQCWALSVIAAEDGLGVTELARAMDIHQSTASNLVKTLVSRELVHTAKQAADRRIVQLRVTDKGREVLATAPGPFTGVLPQALARLDAETLCRLEEDLAKLITTLGPDAGGANVPLGL